MTFWIVTALVVVAGFAIAWWSSGRKRSGLDAGELHTRIGKGQGDVTRRAGRGTGANSMPGVGPGPFG